MVQTPVKQITLAEFLDLPDTKPASEYIDGQISQKPMPQGHHSIIQMELGTEISLTLRRTGIATAFPELRCTFGGRSIVIIHSPQQKTPRKNRLNRSHNSQRFFIQ
jgi:Uma2 family endonuclease